MNETTLALIQRNQRQLARRQLALKATLDEITLLETAQAAPQTPERLHAINLAIAAAQTKRDRQYNATKASEGIISALQDGGKKAK